MSKGKSALIAALVLILSALLLASCQKPEPTEAYPTGLKAEGFRTEYTEGDSLDLDGAALSLVLSDGSAEDAALTEDMIYGFSTARAGSYDLTVVYREFSLKIKIDIAPATVYAVSFLAGEESAVGTPPASYTKSEGANITLPANPFSVSGKTFAGWLGSDGQVYAEGAVFVMPGGEVTFTAQWEDLPRELGFALSLAKTNYIVVGRGTVTDTDIVIPSEYKGLPVTVIYGEAFYGENITSVSIPDSVNYIGASAFAACTALTSIYIPSSVTTIKTIDMYSPYYYPPFMGCSPSLTIYCEDQTAPETWETYWNYYQTGGELTVVYGVTREEYLEAIS